MITIVKYPNRKLYNKTSSEYITLDDVKNYVVENKEFNVVDHVNKNDITEITVLRTMVKVLSEKKGNLNKYKDIINFI